MPVPLFPPTVILLVCFSGSPNDPADLLHTIRAVGKEGAGSAAARTAWQQLVARGPAVLPQVLRAMDTPDTVAATWLRNAFDEIVAADRRAGGKGIDADALLAFVRAPQHQGRARRLALEVVEGLRPGTTAALLDGWRNDPEFRPDAIAFGLQQVDRLKQAGRKPEAVTLARELFAASRDVGQCRAVANALQELGVRVSVADHLGCLRDWYVIGPFPGNHMKGFQTTYPPEQQIDLTAAYDGQSGKVRWQRFTLPEPGAAARDTHFALINLTEPLGNAEDAVAYAYTAVRVPAATDAEFRGAADDNFTVWVNGQKLFAFEEYRNGVRLDRHRFKVRLQPGVNRVLVKVCQAKNEPGNTEPNWEFLLRVVDADGKGLKLTTSLPEKRD